MRDIQLKYTKIIYQEYKDDIEVTDDAMAEKHGFDHSRLVAHTLWEPEKPNIHFLYFDFRK